MANIMPQFFDAVIVEAQIQAAAQRIAFGADVSAWDPLLVAAARILLTDYTPRAVSPSSVYVDPRK